MRSNLTLVFSAGALIVSIAAFMHRRDVGPQAAGAPEAVSAPRMVASPPVAGEAGCPLPKEVDDLRGVMRTGINQSMTRLSFALHHGPEAERMPKVEAEARRLLACIRVAARHRPELGLSEMPDYYGFLSGVQENALAVHVAAMEQDADGALHWFRHLKQDCYACHSRFRVEAGATQAPTAAP